jgi:nitrate reductase NapE component
MNTKRLITLLLVVVLTVVCGATAVAAQDANELAMAVEVTSSTALQQAPVALKPGDSIDVSVTITKATGIKGFFEFVLEYDETALEATVDADGNVAYTSGKLFGESTEIFYAYAEDAGKLQYRVDARDLAEAVKVTETKVVVSLKLKVKDTFHGDTGFKLTDVYCVNGYDLAMGTVSDSTTQGYDKATITTHKYGAPVTTEADCVNPATSKYTCSIAGCPDKELVVETAPAKGHTPGAEATCTAAQTCTVCKVELAPKKAHTPGAEATCTSNQTCTVCNTELAPKKAHTPGAAATCTAAQTCTVCNTELAPKAAHTPGAEATCDTAQTCTVCNVELVAAKGHTPEEIPATAATCTEDGLTKGSKCSVCNKVLEEQTKIEKTGHSFGEWTLKQEATRKAEGIEERTCTACGHAEQRSVAFDGLSTLAIVIIIVAIVAVLGAGGFCVYWFVIKKKRNA